MNKCLVSVVTVVRNGEKYIEDTIRSVLNQTYEHIEYIIIDGMSSDKTPEIISKYRDKIAVVQRGPDTGIYDAMNKGIALATGEWINFMNVGDGFYSNETIVDIFKVDRSEFDIIYGDSVNTYPDVGFDGFVAAGPLCDLFKYQPMDHQSLFVKTILLKNECFDLHYKLAADYNFILNAYLQKRKFFHVNVIVTRHSYGIVGASESNRLKSSKERWDIVRKHRKDLSIRLYYLYDFVSCKVKEYSRMHLPYNFQRTILRMKYKVRDKKRSFGTPPASRRSVTIRIPLINLSAHGGVRVIVELANALVKKKYHVEVIIPKNKISTPYKLDGSVSVKHIGIESGNKFFDYLLFLLMVPFHLKDGIIIANFFVTYFSVRLAAVLFKHVDYFYFVQDIESKYKGVFGAVLNFACNLTYSDKRIIAANRYLETELKKRNSTLLGRINIGPSELFFSRQRQVGKKYDLLYILRTERWKQIDRFDSIAAQLKIKICCISQKDDLIEKYSGMGFECFKPANDTELIDCIDASKVFLLTSSEEGFSLPPLEAMARGVPAVVFECGGPSLYIKNSINSYVVQSVDEAVEKIKLLLSDQSLYKQMSKKAIDDAKLFSLSNGLSQFIRLLS